MNIAIIILAGLIVGLTALHLMREDYTPSSEISFARVVAELELPKPKHPSYRWGPQHLVRSLPFFIRLLMFVLALVAGCSAAMTGLSEKQSLGLWLIVDTSASMTTMQEGKARMELAQAEAVKAIDQSIAAASGVPLCWRLATFDVEWKHPLPASNDRDQVLQAVRALKPRLLGTNLDMLRNIKELRKDPACPVTQVVVIADQGPPGWLGDLGVPVTWRDIAQPVDNLGLTKLAANCETLTGRISNLAAEITAYGARPDARLRVRFADGTQTDYPSQWRDNGTWVQKIPVRGNETFTIELNPEEAFVWDDRAEIRLGEGSAVRVDWQLPERDLFKKLITAGWQADASSPDLRITRRRDYSDTVPTLIVGTEYDRLQTAPSPIEILFDPALLSDPNLAEPSLLRDLNLDAVEAIGLVGVDLGQLPAGFQPVLSGKHGVWLAQRADPLAVYVPGLPTASVGAMESKQPTAASNSQDSRRRVSTTIFFNAVRWLLQSRQCPSIYKPTDRDNPEPGRNRLVPSSEGNTSGKPGSLGEWSDIVPAATAGTQEPIWPLFLLLILVLFVLERLLAMRGGERWR